MTDTVTPVRITGADTAPAVFKPGWLPDDAPFPELDELRETYLRLYEQRNAEGAKTVAITEKIEAAKKQREADLREAMLNGTSADAVEDNSEVLKAELEVAGARSKAAYQALVEHINHAIAVVLEKRPEWLAQIESQESDLNAEVEELENQLRAVHARKGSSFRLEHWLDRTQAGAEFPPSFFPYSEIPPPQSVHPADQAADKQRLQEESYAGGLPGTSTKISDEQGEQREREHESSLGAGDAEASGDPAAPLPTVGGVSS
ncbi:MAG TPA: hypothetical protein VH081_07025 [Solirubrobacteraceae bacterium]|nr:hypothetical protein [Solirubrobacteraceae bacterium]